MKTLVTSPFTHISSNMHSHRAAQAAIYANQLKESGYDVHLDRTGDIHPDINSFEEIYVYHGNDWGGSLNLFGGMKNYSGINNLIRYSQFKGRVHSLWIDHPKYSEMLEPRLTGDISPDWAKVDWENLKRIENNTFMMRMIHKVPNIVVGDSHAICMYRPDWHINSVPFKTLHGALNEGLDSFIDAESNPWDNVEFYFGNIDNRHHLNRLPDPEKSARNLANRYHDKLANLKQFQSVSAYELLPIENESRLLPKTGYYKGTPFYGSWQEREDTRLAFKDEMKNLCNTSNVNFIEWVDYLLNDKGELGFEFMEKPKSVHLSRESYPYWQGWNWNGHSEPIKKLNKTSLEAFFT